MSSTTDSAIDAIDLYINYDPNIVEVEDVVIGKGLPQPSFKKINAEKGMVVLNFLIKISIKLPQYYVYHNVLTRSSLNS